MDIQASQSSLSSVDGAAVLLRKCFLFVTTT